MQDLELLQSFYSEGLDMLDEVEPKLVEIQHVAENQGAFNPEQINAVFRLFHSLKGSAGFLQLNHIAAVTHEAETLLDLFRKGKALMGLSRQDTLSPSGMSLPQRKMPRQLGKFVVVR